MTRVGVIGANGAMGRLAVAAIGDSPDLELGAEIGRGDELGPLESCDVAVELTHPSVVMDHLAWCVSHGLSVVVGTSGFTADRLSEVAALLGDDPAVAVLVVPNFSIGAVLMMRYAAAAAQYFESVEIVEIHHPDKRDAPSGTALRTAQLVDSARREHGRAASPDSTEHDRLGTRGGKSGDTHIHSVRLRGAVAHQEVLFGNPGEILTIRHDMLDRSAAMPGLLACVRECADRRGLVVGIDEILHLDRDSR